MGDDHAGEASPSLSLCIPEASQGRSGSGRGKYSQYKYWDKEVVIESLFI